MRLCYRLDGHFTTMTINVYNAYIKNGKFFFGVIGQIISDACIEPDDLAERIWDMTNWSCWAGIDKIGGDGLTKNGVTYYPNDNDQGFTNDDIMFCINDKWWVAKSFGWLSLDSFSDAAAYLFCHAEWIHNKLDQLK